MTLPNVGKMASLGMAVVAISGFVAARGATMPNAAPNVTYTASGMFSTPATSGLDTLKLAGEPFTISIVANAASPPIEHGPNWAVMSPFKMTGTVHSGLLGPSPINIASGAASIYQLVGPAYDLFTTAFPVKVVGISLTIDAQLTLPPGTIGTPLIHPFASVPLDPTNSIATLTISTRGTVVATIPTGSVAEAARSQGGRPQSEGTMPMEPVPGEMWGSLVGCGPALSGSSRLKSRLRA